MLTAGHVSLDSCLLKVFYTGLKTDRMVKVLKLPPGAQLLGLSPTSPLDAWTFGKRLLALQGHPEMTCSMVAEKILQPLTANGYDNTNFHGIEISALHLNEG